VILIDTSAWVEFLRDTGSPICQLVDDLLAVEIATCDVVRMEVLAGARNEQHLQQLRRLLARASTFPTAPVDYDAAAALYRTCRQRGHTVRKLIDCLMRRAAPPSSSVEFRTIAACSPSYSELSITFMGISSLPLTWMQMEFFYGPRPLGLFSVLAGALRMRTIGFD
jgi:predicted nucleic acid-binding protein